MSNTKGNRGIISPVKGKKDPRVGPDVLMVMIRSELMYMVQLAGAQEVSFSEMNLYRLYQTMDVTGPLLTLCGPFLGAPHAVIGMEKLIVLGAKRIWVLGWCGSLHHDLRIGDIVIPTSAVSEEGTSAHYPIPGRGIEPDADLGSLLEKALKEQDLSFCKGTVWTTDAVYRETRDKVKKYQDQGILAVEMEISALMTLAIYRSVQMAGLFVVSDELSGLEWRHGFSYPLLKKTTRAAGEVLLSLAGYLSKTLNH
ncbi:MAG: nucleoside phosphorylase [Thermodesulfobacteriota bacterium]|nr:nucleoside phosphorylase [Thermodesulfobacteriota bacterium]